MDKDDIANAVFGLGAYIDMMIDAGHDPARLDFLMQSYLNLQAEFAGRERRALGELQSQTAVVAPSLRVAVRAVQPRWLPDGEKLRIVQSSSPCKSPYSDDLDAQL